jgi:hypothetical protein
MTDTKQQVRAVLRQLPDNCTMEDVQYQLYVVEKIRRGLESADRGELYTQTPKPKSRSTSSDG